MKSRAQPGAEALAFLCGLPFFSQLNEFTARQLAETSHFHHLTKGEILFFDSDPCEAVYVVRSGTISIVLNSPDGREMIIDEVHPGEMLGELEALTGKPRSAGATARANAEVLVVSPEAFLRAVESDPLLARRVLDVTARRLQKSTRRQTDLAFTNAHARLARALLTLEEEQRATGYVTISQEELARGTGLIRQTVAKALGEWRRNGWLLTGRGRIVVLNRKALEKLEAGLVH